MSNLNVVLAKNTDKVSKGICDFSQTVAFSHYNHLSAQLPLDSKTNELVSGGIKEQAIQSFKNLEEIITSINHVMNDVIRITIFTKNIKDMEAVEEVYKTIFKTHLPTLTEVIVKDIPLNALVQIEAVITCGEGTIPNAPQAGDIVQVVTNTENAPKCELSSQSIAFSHYNNITTQLPIDPKTGKIVGTTAKEQLKQSLTNVKNVLLNIDVPFDDIVKVTIYTKDLKETVAIKEMYKTFFPDSAIARAVDYLPALSIVEVVDLAHGALVSVETVISHGDGTPPQIVEDRHGIVIEANNSCKVYRCSHLSHSVAFSHYNNLSSQFPVDIDNKLVSGGIKEQTTQCLENMKNILENVEHEMADVVKLNIFVKNISDVNTISEVLKTFFPALIPAGRIVEVANIQYDALVQIDAVVGNAEGTPPVSKQCCSK